MERVKLEQALRDGLMDGVYPLHIEDEQGRTIGTYTPDPEYIRRVEKEMYDRIRAEPYDPAVRAAERAEAWAEHRRGETIESGEMLRCLEEYRKSLRDRK